MMITIYKGYQKYLTHSFPATELDNIKKMCYDIGIKWYTISYNDKEIMEYEQFSKRHN
jgi:hypothetical protein